MARRNDSTLIRLQPRSRGNAVAGPDGPATAGAPEPLRGAGAFRNTAFGLVTQATTAVFTAILVVYLARALGESKYGIFALALSINLIALLACDAGISHSAARFIAERHIDRAAVVEVAAGALRLTVVTAVISAALLWILAVPIASAFGQTALVWPLRGMALAVIGQSVLLLYLRIFAGARRVGLGVGVQFVESLLETTASIALVALGAGVTGATFGRAVGYAAGAAAAMIVCARAFGRSSLDLHSRGSARGRDVARYAAPLLVTNSIYTLYAVIDTLLIGAILTTSDVGLFAGPMRLVLLLGYVGQAVAGALAPTIARTRTDKPDASVWRAGLRWLLVFQWLLVAPLLVWSTPIMVLLLGEGFRASGPVLRVLAVYVFLVGLSPLLSMSVNYLGQGARRIPITLTALLVNVVLDVVLLHAIGVVGAAIGTGVAYAIYVPAHFKLCRKAFDIPLRPLIRTAVRSGLAAAAMAVVLLAVGTSTHLSPEQWVAGLVGGGLAFIAVLFATRELTPTDVRSVFRFFSSRARAGVTHSEVAVSASGGQSADYGGSRGRSSARAYVRYFHRPSIDQPRAESNSGQGSVDGRGGGLDVPRSNGQRRIPVAANYRRWWRLSADERRGPETGREGPVDPETWENNWLETIDLPRRRIHRNIFR